MGISIIIPTYYRNIILISNNWNTENIVGKFTAKIEIMVVNDGNEFIKYSSDNINKTIESTAL